MNEDIVSVCGAVGFFVVLFSFIIIMRFLSYRETMALADKGLVRGSRIRGDGKDTLRWGIVIAAIGLAMCVGLYPIGLMGGGARWPLGFGPWMLAGLLPTFFGMALVLIYVLTRDDKKKDGNGNGNGNGHRPEPPPATGT
jgi:hypothetical protein